MNCSGREKEIENALASIASELVTATKKIHTAKMLCAESNQLLLTVQTQMADLHRALGTTRP